MNQLRTEAQRALCEALASGLSVRAAARAAGVSKATARSYRALLASHGVLDGVRCGCGREPGHRGWCETRVVRSGSRSAFLTERWGVGVSNILEARGLTEHFVKMTGE